MNIKEKTGMHPAWRVFIGTCIVSLLGYGLTSGTSGVFTPVITADIGMEYATFSISSIVMTITMTVFLPLIGRLVKKINLKIMVSCAALICLASFLVRANSNGIVGLCIYAVLAGIAGSVLYGTMTSIILTAWFNEKLGTVQGIAGAVGGFSAALFTPVVSSAVEKFGWRATSIGIGVAVAAVIIPSAIFTLAMPDEKHRPYGITARVDNRKVAAGEDGLTHKEASKKSAYYFVVVSLVFSAFCSMVPAQTNTQILSKGFTLVQAGFVASTVMLGSGFGKIFLGILVDKFGVEKPTLLYAILGSVGAMGFVHGNGYVLLIVCGFLAGIGTSMHTVALPVVLKSIVSAKAYGTVYSSLNMLTCIVPMIIIIPINRIYDNTKTFNAYYGMCALFLLLSAWALIAAYRKNAKEIKEIKR